MAVAIGAISTARSAFGRLFSMHRQERAVPTAGRADRDDSYEYWWGQARGM